ncbi:hypothetical protein HO173_009682 [Letharia columbiana]|uniref:Uncharacterized protein n=1 Tax=Letharia columbiana TaxID=112416 RepID=A0A8H6FP38_9LECA|nr:uncharacterized protein HO173_009682 [Letharia columbiana]KAF6232088.1 hypothetical protein HO173_009682 [Letharia columbiana]
MEMSLDILPNADDNRARDLEVIHLNRMSSNISSSADQNKARGVQQTPRDALNNKIDELEQRLAALTADISPSKVIQCQLQNRRRADVTHTTLPKCSGKARNSTAPTSQVPSASSSRREGRAPTTTRPSASSSRRSSFRVNQPASTQTSRPARLNRRNNTTWPPPTVLRDGKQALQSLRAFSDLRDDVYSAMQAEEPYLPFRVPQQQTQRPPSSVSTANDVGTGSSQDRHEYSNHVPAANIDWTSASTRRREYEKIDQARSGLRGFIRRVTPRILRRKTGRVGFHDDGKGSDAGTVRRFRMDVADGDSAVDESAKSHWWKFGKKKKAKGKGTSSSTEL